jgi:hypothetical protein
MGWGGAWAFQTLPVLSPLSLLSQFSIEITRPRPKYRICDSRPSPSNAPKNALINILFIIFDSKVYKKSWAYNS